MGRRRKGNKVDGIILIDKPSGVSSNHVVQRVKRIFNAQKAGHTGALDPLATGMLPICLGEATKFSQYSLDADKAYTTTALLGVRTDTSDADGDVVETKNVTSTLDEISEQLQRFRGELQQTPSPFSALKYNGKPLYFYARQGIDVPRPTRNIHIYHNEIIDFDSNFLKLEIHCSKGTYIRTIVDDLGQALGCGAHVTELRRLWVSGFKKQKMYSFEELETLLTVKSVEECLDEVLLPMDVHLSHLPVIHLDEPKSIKFQHGMQIDAKIELSEPTSAISYRVYSAVDARFLGMATCQNNIFLQPKRLVVYE